MDTEEFESFHLLTEHPVLIFVIAAAILIGFGLFFTAILSKPRVRRDRIRDDKAGASESRREPSDGVDVSSEEELVEPSGIKGLSSGREPSDMESSLNKGECRPAEF